MKNIPIALLNHKKQFVTTLTDLMQIGPLADGSYRGFTLLDAPVTYPHCVHPITLQPAGEITFHARTGYESSEIISTSDTGVDNAEAKTLPPYALFSLEGITQAQVDSGALDKIPLIVYRVNYKELEMRHEIVFCGTVGEVKFKVGSASILEMRGISNQAKQYLCELDSLLCRVRKFGSQAGEERFPCFYSLGPEWIESSVTDVDEVDRVFSTDLDKEDDYFSPGIIEWLTGANNGLSIEVEGYSEKVVTLNYVVPNPIKAGDKFRIRRECTRAWGGHNSCETFFGQDRIRHFRGEPHMPIGDANALLTPGADSKYSGPSGTGE